MVVLGLHCCTWGLHLVAGLRVLVAVASLAADSAVVAHGLSCSTACGTFQDQSWKPCPLYWQADS